ncbi:MAG: PadR family transcriptional regulator [Desulfocucumaceae bacterium]
MSLPHILLGFINYQPATGYEIKAAFEQSVHFFWNATLPQIYRTLNQMEEKNWLSVTVEHQDGKPSRKVYSITEIGKKEFRRWLPEPPEASPPRSPMLVKVFFGNQMDRNDMADLLLECRRDHMEQIEKYKKEILPVMEHYSKLAGAPEDARFWGLTLDFGLRYTEMVVEWCDSAIKSLETEEGKD